MDQIIELANDQRIGIVARGFELLGLEITEDVAMKLIGAALGDHVDDAAERLSVLRFKAAGLHLDFLDKIEIDTVAQGAVHAAVSAKTAKARIGDVGAIDDVFVFKTGSAIDGGIRGARAVAIGTPGAIAITDAIFRPTGTFLYRLSSMLAPIVVVLMSIAVVSAVTSTDWAAVPTSRLMSAVVV